MKDNKMLKYPLILGTIALVAGLILALVYNVTSPIIEKNKNKRENAVVVEMFGDDVKIEDISLTLEDDEKDIGITSVVKARDEGKLYYVYKVTFKDAFDGDESSYVLAIDNNGKIFKFKFTSTGDSYAGNYNSTSYINGLIGKNTLTENDTISGATKTGSSIIESINAAIAHKGRVD